jgi:hypothetical protein
LDEIYFIGTFLDTHFDIHEKPTMSETTIILSLSVAASVCILWVLVIAVCVWCNNDYDSIEERPNESSVPDVESSRELDVEIT